MKKQEIIDSLKEMHPYPNDVFIEPTKEQWKKINKALQDAGFNETGVHGAACRIGYNAAIHNLEKLILE